MKIGHLFNKEDDHEEVLNRLCFFKKYYGATWKQILEREPSYVTFILYETDLELDSQLVEALESALEEQGEF